jgi:putative transposase
VSAVCEGRGISERRACRVLGQYRTAQRNPGQHQPDEGSCIRLRPEYPNQVWAYDFLMDPTHDGKAFRLLTIVDEYTRECFAIVVARKLAVDAVLATLTDLFIFQATTFGGGLDHLGVV